MSRIASAVYVEWEDSYGLAGGVWQSRADWKPNGHKSCSQHRSIGWVIHEDTKWLVLAGHEQVYGDSIGGGLAIPKCAITKRRWVKLP